MEYPTITTYKGRRIDELTREELLEALTIAAQEINKLWLEKERERNFVFDTFITKKGI